MKFLNAPAASALYLFLLLFGACALFIVLLVLPGLLVG